MEMTNHRAKAQEHVEAVQCTLAALDDLRLLPDSAQRSLRINRAHDAIRQGLKLAEVHAQLAISEQLSCLASRVEFLFTKRPTHIVNYVEGPPPPLNADRVKMANGYRDDA